MSDYYNESAERLFRAIAGIETPEECRAFFEDLCTIREIQDMSQRLDTAVLLSEGNSYQKIAEKYEIIYFKQVETSHLQVYLLSDLLEIDIGYGGYEDAAARKPAFKVLYERSGVVEEKMIRSREWMDDALFTDKQKNDLALACDTVWAHLMHAAVAIRRGNSFRAIGELEYVRKVYIDLLGDRYRLESGFNRDIDKLPQEAKEDIKSTLVFSEEVKDLWTSLLNLTSLVYKSLISVIPYLSIASLSIPTPKANPWYLV